MPSDKELREAAERKELREAAERLILGTASCFLADTKNVAQAYLAEHPADDDEPVDEAWLLSNGFTDNAIQGWGFIAFGGHEGTLKVEVQLYESGDNHVYVEYKRMFVDAKRGDVRRLCRTLGVALKEGS